MKLIAKEAEQGDISTQGKMRISLASFATETATCTTPSAIIFLIMPNSMRQERPIIALTPTTIELFYKLGLSFEADFCQ